MLKRTIVGLLLATTCHSSFFGSKKEEGTCGGEKSCGDDENGVKKWDPMEMWTKKKSEPENEIGPEARFFDKEGQFDGKTAQAVLKKLEEKPRVLEEKCSELTGVCYEVVDRVWRDPDGFSNNKWEMLRQVQLKGQVNSHFGRATLIKPTELNWKTYDTKNWEINKNAIIDREIQTLIGGLTGSKSIPRKEENATREYNVLLIGLGTPTIPNFLERYHWIDVLIVDKEPLFFYFAKKWFNMRMGPNLRNLHADEISLMSFVVTQEVFYDAVLINLCKDYVDPRPCPTDVYLERGTMQVIKNIVREETGMVGINTRSTDKKHEKEVANAYGNVFPMCFDYPGEHKKLTFERYKSTVCYNREHPPFWSIASTEYMKDSHHDWFYYV